MKRTASLMAVVMLAFGLVAMGCSSSESAKKDREDKAEQKMKESAEDTAEKGVEEAKKAEKEEKAEGGMAESDAKADAAAEGPAIDGYCPVAYKMAGKPIQGKKEFAVEHDGKTWHLANEKAMKAFKEDPSKFEVKYAGWCATGLSMGKQVEVDPTLFTVHNEKIYLFSSEDAKKAFDAKPAEMAKKAESNWSEMHSEKGKAKAKDASKEGKAKAKDAAKEGEKSDM